MGRLETVLLFRSRPNGMTGPNKQLSTSPHPPTPFSTPTCQQFRFCEPFKPHHKDTAQVRCLGRATPAECLAVWRGRALRGEGRCAAARPATRARRGRGRGAGRSVAEEVAAAGAELQCGLRGRRR